MWILVSGDFGNVYDNDEDDSFDDHDDECQ